MAFVPVQIESISELGIVIRTTLNFKVGQTIDLRSIFIDQLGDKLPPLKVLSINTSDKADVWRIELIFLGASEALLQKIRRYIFSHGASSRSAA